MKSTLPILTILSAGIQFQQIEAFSPIGITPAKTALNAVELMTLESLENHEDEGKRLSASIAGWLDKEWMPQDIHRQIGESAKATYVGARESGETEIMNIMTHVVDVLVEEWPKYDAEAFVNAWDIGNYVSDYLLTRLGVEECGCHASIFNPDEVDSN
mmetsp:Transcript_20113/g.29851  ORF Transcript_20113/g.29851 Transcript_20113/m.29851 type:complete len:158 (-) Transcript_20113:130-603(-)|eukprot:CAMPEP_0194208278 /NCGR_PEP_ID=MMETSP0156-20130528/6773_1 /TAXON_ID=33649 /ORGANISM="Thalassionema nitzschioides, Strain L26-B" /LENGTH=157 /DNA_ID=CAMNT_0038935209 /DNA_START=153 /DNA_END=626 /DNA_ORIENTATION=-